MQTRPDDNESIKREISLIGEYFGDVLSKYGFTLTEKDTLHIQYENECFFIFFGYDYNQWGYMLFNGIGIGIKETGKMYWLGHVLQAITGDKNLDLEKEAELRITQSPRGMIDFEAQRLIWEPYIVDTFKDCDPAWKSAL